ncbi:uncharacterized protein G2W53_004205 [Senna tora]|uniref:Uncharacterized protein n=1 Tax=Senna tora TaxID=362788 RepID=A0A835CJZ5_9FABA|nr:uncharacterized protein G2W53_004205 [Senna tora]
MSDPIRARQRPQARWRVEESVGAPWRVDESGAIGMRDNNQRVVDLRFGKREQPSNESSAAPESSLKFLVQLRASCWKSAVRWPIYETLLLDNGSCLCLGQGAFDVMTRVMITYEKSSISNKIEVAETGPEARTPSLTHYTVSIVMFSWGAFNGSGTNNTLNEKSGIP